MAPRRPLFRQIDRSGHRAPQPFDELLTLPGWDGWRALLPAGRPLRTPTILQMDAAECGAACLAIVLGHFGRWVPLGELRIACGTSRDGVRASNLARAARSYGLEVRAFSCEPAELRELPLPQIVFWEFQHFVVVEGFDERRVWLNDPASGPRAIGHAEFDERFTGVVLSCTPGPEFTPGGEQPRLSATLRHRLAPARRQLAGLALATLGLLAVLIVLPLLAGAFAGSAGGQTFTVLGLLALGLGTAGWLQQRALAALEQRILAHERGGLMAHLLRLPISFFTQRYPGELNARMGLVERLAGLLGERVAGASLGLLLALACLLFTALVSWQIALVTLLVALAELGLLSLMVRRRVQAAQREVHEGGRLSAALMHDLQSLEAVKAMGGEPDVFTRWAGHQALVEAARAETASTGQALQSLAALATALGGAAVLTAGALLAQAGQVELGTLLAALLLSASCLSAVGQLVAAGGALQELGLLGQRIDDIRSTRPEQLTMSGEDPVFLEGAPALELRAISFGYGPLAPPLLHEVSLSVAAGERVALVGCSGSGKSTLARIAAGLLRPWDGTVLIGGVTREALDREALARRVAAIDQELVLFSGTVRDNLSLWDVALSDEQLLAAAEDAGIAEAIAERGGLDALVEEDGLNWSGGQRQRLELARALARDPALLILDEATSALDTLAEEQLAARLRARGCACLIVAHRLSAILGCERVVMLDGGQVLDTGTHAELLERCRPYARLVAQLERR